MTGAAVRHVKAGGRRVLAWSSRATGIARRRLEGKVAILGYHRVVSREELRRECVQPGMYVEAGVFEAHVQFLARCFQVLSFEDLLRRWAEHDWDSAARYCVITFDDGWRDNYVHAYPVLRRYGLPATVFVPTTFIGTRDRFWSDNLATCLDAYRHLGTRDSRRTEMRAVMARYPWLPPLVAGHSVDGIDRAIEKCKALPAEECAGLIRSLCGTLQLDLSDRRVFVDWDEVKKMSQDGISFGSHSSTHRILPGLDAVDMRREAEESLAVLRGSGARFVPVFCYPNGDSNRTAVEVVRSAGYRAAIAGVFGLESGAPEDLFQLRRVGVHNDVSANTSLLELRMAGLGVMRR